MQLEDIDLTAWIGRTETAADTVTPTPVRALTATLDHPAAPVPAGTPLPPLWHWLYFLPVHQQSEIGPDGHARRGGFLPPVELPRRMWAGGRFEFRSPIRVGDEIVRTSTIDNVTSKVGRTGPLVFVTVRHEVRSNGARRPGAGRVPRHRLPGRTQPGRGRAAAHAGADRARRGSARSCPTTCCCSATRR